MPSNSLRSIIFYFLFSIFFTINLFAATSSEYTIRQLKVKDGLSQSSILAILQDHVGYMWIGTVNGLNKYDGYDFKIYLNDPKDSTSISDNRISAIFEDSNGFLWFGTNEGFLNKFDRRKEIFIRYNLEILNIPFVKAEENIYEYPILFSRSNEYSVTTICEDIEGNLWAGTWGKGIFILRKDGKIINLHTDTQNKYSICANRITKIISDRNNNLWIGTLGGGVSKIDSALVKNQNYQFQTYRHDPLRKSSLSDERVTTIYENKKGEIWIGTFYGGLHKLTLDEKNKSVESAKFICFDASSENKNNLNTNSIMALTEDDSGNIWIGTFGGGLNRFDEDRNSFVHFLHKNSGDNTLADNDIISLTTDKAGIIWAGSHLGEGISTLERKQIKFNSIRTNAATNSGLNDDVVWAIFEDHEKLLWIGTYRGGLNRFDEQSNTFSYYKNEPGNLFSLSGNHVRSIAEDPFGNMWIGTYSGGLNHWNRTSNRFTRYLKSAKDSFSIGGNQIQRLYIDSDSVMWIGVFGGGLNKLDLKNFDARNPRFIKYMNNPADPFSISDNRIYAIYEDRGKNLWIGTFGGGLNKFDKKNGVFERFVNERSNPSSLPNNRIMCLYEDLDGNFWVGTSGNGLVKFDRTENKYKSYGAEDGISTDVIYGILEDDQNNLWLSTSNGIFKYSYRTGKSMNYGLQDGVQSLEFNGGAYFKASDGEMYFGGISGINNFYPQDVKNNQFIPPIVITSIKIANNKLKGEIDSLMLSYDENFVTFEFAALSYSNPEYNYYSYMLTGFDANWKFTDAKYRVANYTNLPPGTYIFKVRGANNDRVWNPIETEVLISISPPFWRTFWFISLAVILISTGIYYLGTIRSRNELLIERLKAKLAADLHDNVGSGLTEISILSELAQQNASSTNVNVHSKLKNISEISRQLVDNMSDIVWVVNPNRDSLRDLLVRLKDSYSDILNFYGISFRIINIDKLEDLSLPMEYRQNLYLMFKEGINNTIKHSKCKKITLEANVRKNIIELTLKDDGIGFSTDESPLGNGIRNIETRSKNIGGKIKWKSSPGMGTTITFIGEIKNLGFLDKFFSSTFRKN